MDDDYLAHVGQECRNFLSHNCLAMTTLGHDYFAMFVDRYAKFKEEMGELEAQGMSGYDVRLPRLG